MLPMEGNPLQDQQAARIETTITYYNGSTRSFRMKMKVRGLRQIPSKVYTRKIESQASF
jgi:hypothetical protein